MRRVFSPGVGSLWDPCSGAHSDRHGNRACGREKIVRSSENCNQIIQLYQVQISSGTVKAVERSFD